MAWPKGKSRAKWNARNKGTDNLGGHRFPSSGQWSKKGYTENEPKKEPKKVLHRNGSLRVHFCPFCRKTKPLVVQGIRYCIGCERAFKVVKP